MASVSLESRVAALETEVFLLRQQLKTQKNDTWKRIIGSFANDPLYEEAMKLGRQYRESLRPRAKRPKKRKKTS